MGFAGGADGVRTEVKGGVADEAEDVYLGKKGDKDENKEELGVVKREKLGGAAEAEMG